jgi:anti-sigma regulatory factor (Ser/Thr protein kinase)
MANRSFPHSPESVSEARRFAAEVLASLPSGVVEKAQLLVSELATNALLYSSGGFEVSAAYSRRTGRIRVGVTDVGEGRPRVEQPDVTDEHGRGLQLVTAFSDSWGIEPRRGEPGKTVWFELIGRTEAMSD